MPSQLGCQSSIGSPFDEWGWCQKGMLLIVRVLLTWESKVLLRVMLHIEDIVYLFVLALLQEGWIDLEVVHVFGSNDSCGCKFWKQRIWHMDGGVLGEYHRPTSRVYGIRVFRLSFVKGIFSDSNSTFLWHKSQDINKKSFFFSKMSVNSDFPFASYAWFTTLEF